VKVSTGSNLIKCASFGEKVKHTMRSLIFT
jgi:hypothetical protein